MARERRHVDALTLINAAGQAAGQARSDRDDLADLKIQLKHLAASAGSALNNHVEGGERRREDRPGAVAAVAAVSEEENLVRSEMQAELRRLVQEKAELLETGVYSEQDEIIGEIERQVAAVRQGLQSMGVAA